MLAHDRLPVALGAVVSRIRPTVPSPLGLSAPHWAVTQVPSSVGLQLALPASFPLGRYFHMLYRRAGTVRSEVLVASRGVRHYFT
jgi:hypothetical protein